MRKLSLLNQNLVSIFVAAAVPTADYQIRGLTGLTNNNEVNSFISFITVGNLNLMVIIELWLFRFRILFFFYLSKF